MESGTKTQGIDAHDIEHIGSLVSGGLLLLSGLRRGGPVGFLFKLAGAGLVYRGAQGYGRLYEALGLEMPKKPTGVGMQNVRVESSITVDHPRQDVYRIWRNLSKLPVFMDHLVSVEEIDDQRSVWTAKAPAGTVVRWEAEIVNDIDNELIAWQTLEGSGVDNAGSVHFEEAEDGGTLVRVVLRYDPPADMLGVWIAKIFQNDPQKQIDNDLLRFKQIIELGKEAAARQGRASAM